MPTVRHVATLIALDSSGRVLLQKRGAYAKRGEDVAFFGGGIEAGETPLQALVREIREELDWDLTGEKVDPLGVFEARDPDGTPRAVRHAFVVRTDRPAESLRVLEGEGAFWSTVEAARKLKFPSDVGGVLDAAELAART